MGKYGTNLNEVNKYSDIQTNAKDLDQYDYPFQDPSLPWSDRVDDLVGRLSVEEMVAQTFDRNVPTPSIERLSIKPYVWDTECIRGQTTTNATAFPQALGLAASFSTDLLHKVAEAISYEVRANWNEHVKQEAYRSHVGLSCFSPVINIMRHPLWGRNQETYGEDPYLTSELVRAFVRGLQGSHPRYIRANAGCKHFDVYGGPENHKGSTFHFNVTVSMRDWRMTFLPAFKACVDAGSYSLMCSYMSINGIPSCAHQYLLTNITRNEWGFQGYVVSDADALEDWVTPYFNHSAVDTAAACLKAGCNLELGTGVVFGTLGKAIEEGKLTETELRNSMKPLFYTRMRHGEFDPVDMNPYNEINMSEVQSEAHRKLAITAAVKSFVLLKNDGNILPITQKYNNIAIVGPMANNLEQLYGDYASNVDRQYAKTPLEGLAKLGFNYSYEAGCTDNHCTSYNSSEIKLAVGGCDMVIICLGTGQEIETEGLDRPNLHLPGHQFDILKDAAYYSDTGVPIILLLFNAGPLDITWAKLNTRVPVIMECFLPAQSAGDALYKSLTAVGHGEIPAGRLPATWPANINQIPDIANYTMIGRTYRYNDYDPLYPFGYGLSYTTFSYNNLTLTPLSVPSGENVTASVVVSNTGKYDGDEVVQFYMTWDTPGLPAPHIQLVGVNRLFIPAKKTVEVSIEVAPHQMALWLSDESGFVVSKGKMTLYAGGQQPHQRTSVPSNILSATFTVI